MLAPGAPSLSPEEPKGEVGCSQERGRGCFGVTEHHGVRAWATQRKGDVRAPDPGAASPPLPPVDIFSFSLPDRVPVTLVSRVFFLPVPTFLQICHWFSQVRFTGFKSQSPIGCDLRQLPSLSFHKVVPTLTGLWRRFNIMILTWGSLEPVLGRGVPTYKLCPGQSVHLT